MLCKHKVVGSSPTISIDELLLLHMSHRTVRYDQILRHTYKRKGQSRMLWRALRRNSDINLFDTRREFAAACANFTQCRPKNYCSVTGRARGVVMGFALSRNFFKKYVNSGLLYGVHKVSW